MAKWTIKLAGDEFELRSLSVLYTEPTCLVAKEEDGAYYLTCEDFASQVDVSRADSAYRTQLALINSLMKVRNLDYQSVSGEDIYKVNEDGTRQRYVMLSGVATGRARAFAEATVIGPDGLPVPSPEPAIAQSRLNLAQHDSLVGETLSFWNGCRLGDAGYWFNTNKVYEKVLESMGNGGMRLKKREIMRRGQMEVIQRGWATHTEIRSFEEAANNPRITGNTARHGVGWETPAGITPMNEGEALAFIQRLLNQWLASKIVQTI